MNRNLTNKIFYKKRFLLIISCSLALILPCPIQAQTAREIASQTVQSAKRYLKSQDGLKAKEQAEKLKKIADKRLETDPAAKQAHLLIKGEGQKYAAEEKQSPQKDYQPPEGHYILVISASVPVHTLRAYAEQAETLWEQKHVLIDIILRGGVEGLRKFTPTVDLFYKMAAKDLSAGMEQDNLRQISFSIDPEQAQDVLKVPALKNEKGCIVYGDTNLTFLIEKIEQKKCGEDFGATWTFAEKDAREEIQERMAHVDLNQIEQEQHAQFQEQLKNLPGADLLPAAREDKEYTLIPWYELDRDIYNPKTGDLMYPAGYRFNPLEYVPENVPVQMVLINGTRPAEVEWVKKAKETGTVKPETMVRVLGGNYMELTNTLQEAVFIGTDVAEKGWCHATPCIIEKDGSQFRIKEIRVEDNAAS